MWTGGEFSGWWNQDGSCEVHSKVSGCTGVSYLFILSALLFLIWIYYKCRYQGHFKVLYSNHYGSPQSRARVIFWGARRDMIIPQFPIPTHCLHDPFCAQRINLPTGDVLYPATRAVDIGEDTFRHQCAPFRAPSIDDAISDLVCLLVITFNQSSHFSPIMFNSPNLIGLCNCSLISIFVQLLFS